MMQAVKGFYRDGKVELLEPPSGITEGEVIVTFVQRSSAESKVLPQPSEDADVINAASTPAMMTFGMFASKEGQEITMEDLKVAEFHGDDDDELDWS
ncbi:MAG: hypothetical protein AAF810_12425 [Cyanobacteria bacterium P01_D01_bin.36]